MLFQLSHKEINNCHKKATFQLKIVSELVLMVQENKDSSTFLKVKLDMYSNY